mgnify:CR=1 FL=1
MDITMFFYLSRKTNISFIEHTNTYHYICTSTITQLEGDVRECAATGGGGGQFGQPGKKLFVRLDICF